MTDSLRSRQKTLKWLLPITVILIAAAGVFLIMGGHPSAYYVSIYEGQSEEILYQRQVELNDKLTLNYIHSADKTPISAVFEIKEDGLYLIEEKYSWYGAGLEAGSGHSFEFKDQEVTVSGYERLFEEMPIRVARTVPQEIVINDEVVLLNELAPGGKLLIIRIGYR